MVKKPSDMQSPSFMVETDAEHRKSAFSTQLPKREYHTSVCNCQPCQQPLAGFTAISQVASPPRFMALQSMAGVSVPTPVYLPKSEFDYHSIHLSYHFNSSFNTGPNTEKDPYDGCSVAFLSSVVMRIVAEGKLTQSFLFRFTQILWTILAFPTKRKKKFFCKNHLKKPKLFARNQNHSTTLLSKLMACLFKHLFLDSLFRNNLQVKSLENCVFTKIKPTWVFIKTNFSPPKPWWNCSKTGLTSCWFVQLN